LTYYRFEVKVAHMTDDNDVPNSPPQIPNSQPDRIAVVASNEPPVHTPAIHSLEYTGDGTDMALLFLKNFLLTIITFGIYRAWARTNLRRYVWGHVAFMGDRASYTGTGEELFKGWLKLAGLLIAMLIAVGIINKILPALSPLTSLIVALSYLAIFALATYSGLRYRLSRTKWREIRFGVEKTKESTREFFIRYCFGVFMNFVTFGIYYPWFKNWERTFLVNRSRFGTAFFRYNGDSFDYAGLYFKGLFFSFITLGFYIPWMIRSLTAFRFNHTRFQDARFIFTLKGSDLLVFGICAYFGTLLTLGLAAPWIYNWGLRLFITNTKVEGNVDMAQVVAKDSDGSALGEEVVLDYDLDLGF
jgi:uncharacterized membrane protein YjgN (DUF898 family)